MVIGPDGIKMEEEKVKGVLDWQTPKCIKDVCYKTRVWTDFG